MNDQIVSARIKGSLISLHCANGIAWDQVSPPGPGQPESTAIDGDILVVHMSDRRTLTYKKQKSGSFVLLNIS